MTEIRDLWVVMKFRSTFSFRTGNFSFDFLFSKLTCYPKKKWSDGNMYFSHYIKKKCSPEINNIWDNCVSTKAMMISYISKIEVISSLLGFLSDSLSTVTPSKPIEIARLRTHKSRPVWHSHNASKDLKMKYISTLCWKKCTLTQSFRLLPS